MKLGLYCLLLSLFALANFSFAQRLSLDGEWDFKLIESDGSVAQSGKISVPSPWEAQGYGKEGDKLRRQHVGVGRYERDFVMPESFRGKRISFVLSGISRYAKVWIDGKSIGGEAVGLVGSHRWVVDDFVEIGKKMRVRVDVDSRQRMETDAILGTAQLNDYMECPWGGLWGRVFFEARPHERLDDFYVYSKYSPKRVFARALVNMKDYENAKIVLEVFDKDGRLVGASEAAARKNGGIQEIFCEVPSAELWTPDTPNLYAAELSLFKNGKRVDSLRTRVGIREIATDGHKIFLNGKRLYLFGYGDDHIYPDHVAMPSDKSLHLERLRKIKELGFNHVRHHSVIMPPEYFEACDEIGMLPNAEFPIGYPLQMPLTKAWSKATKGKGDSEKTLALYRQRFRRAVEDFKNYTCIFSWVGGNEFYMGKDFFPRENGLAEDFKKIAKSVDSERFFADTDGEWDNYILSQKNDRDSLDIYYVLFNEWADALRVPSKFDTRKYSGGRPPLKPVISHETGNYTTFSRLAQVRLFETSCFKPFWLIESYKKLEKRGELEIAEEWADSSEKLYTLLHKYNIEAIRKNNDISGYHWWLIQDYWTSSDGIFDAHFNLKKGISKDEIANINARASLLQEGLAYTYVSGGALRFEAMLSNYSGEDFSSTIAVEIKVGGKPLINSIFETKTVAHGELGKIGAASVEKLPEVVGPERLEISLFSTDGKSGNRWNAWLFPKNIKPDTAKKIRADKKCAQLLPPNWRALPVSGGKCDVDCVYVVSDLTPPLMEALVGGARVVLLDAGKIAKPIKISYKSSWWRAGNSESSNQTGTFVDSRNPLVREFMPDKWCDIACVKIMHNAVKYDVADLEVENVVRSLSSMLMLGDYSLLFGAKVGAGTLVVSGFNHIDNAERTESLWLLKRMVDADWTPSKTLDAARLARRAK